MLKSELCVFLLRNSVVNTRQFFHSPPINQVAELEELPVQFLCGAAEARPCCLDAGHQSSLFGAIFGKANLQVLEILSLRATPIAVPGRDRSERALVVSAAKQAR